MERVCCGRVHVRPATLVVLGAHIIINALLCVMAGITYGPSALEYGVHVLSLWITVFVLLLAVWFVFNLVLAAGVITRRATPILLHLIFSAVLFVYCLFIMLMSAIQVTTRPTAPDEQEALLLHGLLAPIFGALLLSAMAYVEHRCWVHMRKAHSYTVTP